MVADAIIIEPLTQTRLSGRTAEISAGGCYVDALNPLPARSVVQISIVRGGGVFGTWGRVVYVHEGIGMGVAFFNTPPDQAEILRSWIAELSA